MPEADPARSVQCRKLGQELPGLSRAPFPNDLGTWIFENISKQAWDQWLQESVRYINTYGWQLDRPKDQEQLVAQLRIWLGLEEGEMLRTAWTPAKDSSGERES